MADKEKPKPWTELDGYERERFHVARDAGFTRLEAYRFAKSDATMYDLRRLIETGCDPRRAYEILV